MGAPGVGDPYFPDLGNGGYDVGHYDLSFTVDPKADQIEATAVIAASARQALGRFDLDLTGLQVSAVTVDGAGAAFTREGRELHITPSRPIRDGADFTTTITYGGSPEPRTTPALPIAVGWIATGDSTYALNEPEGASTWYPVNDHPSDKATYTFRITVPAGTVAVANGELADQRATTDGHTTFVYEEKAPMASYLAQVAVGDYQITSTPGPNGVTIRNAFASPLAAEAAIDFSRTPDMLNLFAGDFGPYPFPVYGALVVNDRTQYALENQTLSLFDTTYVDGDASNDGVVAHELAHQWFGDSLTPATWKDVWLNEGFATYAEWLWTEHTGGQAAKDSARQVHDQLAASGDETLPGDPGVSRLFDVGAVYNRGALALDALRLTIGDDAFFTTLRTYVSRFTGKNVTTADFIAVASEVSHRDLHDLFDQWLYRAPLPALPAS